MIPEDVPKVPGAAVRVETTLRQTEPKLERVIELGLLIGLVGIEEDLASLYKDNWSFNLKIGFRNSTPTRCFGFSETSR